MKLLLFILMSDSSFILFRLLSSSPLFHRVTRSQAHAVYKHIDGASQVRYTVLSHDTDGRNGVVGYERFLVQLRLPFMPTDLTQTPPPDDD